MKIEHGANKEIINRSNKYPPIQLDHSANINIIISKNESLVKKAYLDAYDSISEYPDIEYYELINKISSFEKVKNKDVLVSNGAITLLYDIINIIKPNKSSIIIPTFMEYEKALYANDSKIEYIMKLEDNDSDMLVFCNPNNPTGKLIDIEEIILYLKKHPKQWVIVDESFIDFTINRLSLKEYLNDFPYLIIIKSYTKYFKCPGLRLGICLTSNNEIKDLFKLKCPSWSVNSVISKMIIPYLEDIEFHHDTISFYYKEAQFLMNRLRKIKFIVYQTSTNFIYFKSNIPKLYHLCLLKGLLIRDTSNIRGTEKNSYRICIKDHESNLKLLKILELIYEENTNNN